MPASPCTEICMLSFAPVWLDVSTSWYGVPLPLLTIEAVTPRLAVLIASRRPERVSLPLFSVMLPPLCDRFGVKVDPFCVPNEKVTVELALPLDRCVFRLAWPAVASDCACASCVVLTVYVPGCAPTTALAVSVDVLLEVALNCWNWVGSDSCISDCWNVDSAEV